MLFTNRGFLVLISLPLICLSSECPLDQNNESLSISHLQTIREKTFRLDSERLGTVAQKLGFSKKENVAARQLIIKFKSEASMKRVAETLSAVGSRVLHRFKTNRAMLLEIPSITSYTDLIAHAKALSELRDVEYVHPNTIIRLKSESSFTGVPNDPEYSKLYGLHNTGQTGGTEDADIDAPEAWATSNGSPSVVVGVIDTGIDSSHPDLSSNMWLNTGETGTDEGGNDKRSNGIDDDGNGYVDDYRGWDFVNNDNDPNDDHGHGTHVAGIIGASGNNGLGVVGVAWNTKMVGIKFIDASGEGYLSDAVKAIEYANLMGISITNNSWGGGSFDPTMYAALKAANQKGYVFIAAAGNAGSDNDKFPLYPASYDLPNVISVAATDHNDKLASFSSYGVTSVDLAAPGVDILSTFPSGIYGFEYAEMSGTSMATPYVTGAVALIKSVFPELGPVQIKNRLMGCADKLPTLAGKVASGGRLNSNCFEVDTIPPAAINFMAVTSRGLSQAKIIFGASGDDGNSGVSSNYEIRVSSNPIMNEQDWRDAAVVKFAITSYDGGVRAHLTQLKLGTTGYLSIRALDSVGNMSPISEPFPFSLLEPQLLYAGDANHQQGMVFSGTSRWGVEKDEVRGDVLSDSPNGNYQDNAESILELPAVKVGYPDMILSLATKIDCEASYDWAYIEYIKNQEKTWKKISAYSARSCDWANISLQFGDKVATGDTVRLRFRFVSDYVFQFDGWLIDDIKIFGVKTNQPPTVPKAPSHFVGFSRSGSESSQLFWSDNSTNEDRFELFKADSNKVTAYFKANQNSVSVSDSQLQGGLYLRACRESVCSPFSKPILINPAPVVSSLSPKTGIVNTPSVIKISGAYFASAVKVWVGNNICSIKSRSLFEVECSVTMSMAGSFPIRVQNPQNKRATILIRGFTVRAR